MARTLHLVILSDTVQACHRPLCCTTAPCSALFPPTTSLAQALIDATEEGCPGLRSSGAVHVVLSDFCRVALTNAYLSQGHLPPLGRPQALIDATEEGCPGSERFERGVHMVTLFDHEECGSESPQGAGSPVLRETLFQGHPETSHGTPRAQARTVTLTSLRAR